MEDKRRYFISVCLLVISCSFLERSSYALPVVNIHGPATASEGQPVNLTCTATCSNNNCTDKKWTTPVERREDVYNITSIQRLDAGLYTCTVSDNIGTTTKTHNLTVYYGPDGVSLGPPATTYTLSEGTDALGPVDCKIENCSAPVICTTGWRLPYGQGELLTEPLYIPTVYRNHTGQYTCEGSNSATSITLSRQINVTVHYGPDSVNVGDDTSPDVEEGHSFQATCNCVACVPGCKATWISKSMPQTTDGSLVISNISRSQHGVYTCNCTNGAVPKSMTKDVNINVLYPPIVAITWNEAEKRLACNATGNPAKYTFSDWKHKVGNTLVRGNLKGAIQGNQNILTLNGNQPYMETGTYTCGVSNGIQGYTSDPEQIKERKVTVSDKPVLITSQSEYNISKGSSLNISMRIYAVPSVTTSDVSVKHTNTTVGIEGVSVKTNEALLKVLFYSTNVGVGGKELVIHIDEVKEEYFIGDVLVEIRNTIGNINRTITLNPKGPPDTPTNITYNENINSVSFKLKPGFYNGANQTFYVEYSTDRNATTWNNGTFIDAGYRKAPDYFKEVTVQGLQPETNYFFRIKGVNLYGESSPTEIMEIRTLEEPLNVGAIAGGAVAGAVVVVVIIIIVFIVLKRRSGNKNKKTKETIPMPNILETPTSDQAPMFAKSPRSPYTNGPEGSTNSVVYENTLSVKPDNEFLTENNPKEHIYGNTIHTDVEKQASHYQNFNISENNKTFTPTSEFNRQDSTEPKYLNQQDLKLTIKSNDNQQPAKEATPVSPSEELYLDMEVGNVPITPGSGEQPYLDMEVKPGVKDYINCDGYKKNEKNSVEATKSDERKPYESMHLDVQKRQSIPDYVAPPPPQTDEEDYMNLNMGRKS